LGKRNFSICDPQFFPFMKRAIDSPPPRTTLILQEEPASVKTKQKPCQFMNIQPLLVAVTLTYCLIYNLQLRLGPLFSK